ncbi:nucleoside monophosphate kinase [Dactylosporangium sp. NPDC006015]|uniref:adenylate kinase family protein n=1 Tax=Dactylosporangium sp. NPDC006015 TaxID=3154576 RepID=UPI0033BBB992
MRRLAVIGVPGTDPWAIADMIAARLGVGAVSIRDAMQAEFRAGTALAAEADRFMRAGEIVPTELHLSILLPHLHRDGFVLANFPRDLAHAAGLAERGVTLDRVVDLVLPDAEVVRRHDGQRICRGCGRVWQVDDAPPDRCDRCAGELFRPGANAPGLAVMRVRNYRSMVAPALEHYRALGILHPVDATLPPERIVEAALC